MGESWQIFCEFKGSSEFQARVTWREKKEQRRKEEEEEEQGIRKLGS